MVYLEKLAKEGDPLEHNSLSDMIAALEYGHNFHIIVILFDRCGNRKTRLPLEQRTHETPVCEAAKVDKSDYSRCYRCRETVLRMATTRKKSFGGLCINGVYEYCRPLVRDSRVVGVILIGNIYDGSPEQLRRLSQNGLLSMTDTMQHNFTPQDCERTADILESYISYLLDTYGERTPQTFDTLVENIRNYIEENAHGDVSIGLLAKHFNYNEKYLGRLFKQRTGYTVHEYCNQLRLSKAKKLLRSTNLSIARIAALAGYNNTTYFIRVFKQHTQMSPLQYRQKKRKQHTAKKDSTAQ